MRTITKFISVNDGLQKEVHNGDYLLVEDYPRCEKIISTFLDDGWNLHSRTFRVVPGTHKEGSFNFYIGGWDLLFIKQIEDEQEDNGDTLLKSIINNLPKIQFHDDQEVSEDELAEFDFDDDLDLDE